MKNRIIIDLMSDGGVKVAFPENHFSKRQLMRVLKSLKLEYRRNVRDYRKQIMKGIRNGKERTGDKQGTGTKSEGTGTKSERAATLRRQTRNKRRSKRRNKRQ